MISRLFGKKRGKPIPTADLTIRRCRENLLNGKDADISARTLGDIAIGQKDQVALLVLWEVVCKTDHLRAIIDPCAYTVGRVARESLDPTLEDIGFDIFDKSVTANCEPIVDKFAFTVGEVALRAKRVETRQRAREFVHTHASGVDPLVRRCYAYTKNRIAR
jgi:hypothetical protein